MQHGLNDEGLFMRSCFVFIILLINPLLKTFAAEDSLYDFEWMDQDKKIYVLQNRVYRKEGKIMTSLLIDKTMSDKFYDSYFGIIKGAYFFKEEWGVELTGGFGFGSENKTSSMVREQGAVPFYKKINNYMNANIMWSPFYGKFNAFNSIFYVDWFFSTGLSFLNTSDNRTEFEAAPSGTLTKESSLGINWNTGLLFYISENWMIRFEFQGLHYKSSRYGKIGSNANSLYNDKAFYHQYDVALGVSAIF